MTIQDTNERAQGSSWLYPDAYMLSASESDALLKLVKVQDDEFDNLTMVRYLAVVNSLLKAMSYEHLIGRETLAAHLKHLITETNFIKEGARLALKRSYKRSVILSQHLPSRKQLWLGNIGSCIISVLFRLEKIGLLHKVLRISKLINTSGEHKDYVRLIMIKSEK